MRRMADGWVNATHILKVAGFDKPQRTRILEREIQRGLHEKVQGGYGKYQGTWVPLDRAKEIAAQYNVAEILDPMFSYEPSANSPPPAPKQASKLKSAARTVSKMDSSPSSMPTPKRARKVSSAPGEKRGRGRPPSQPQLSQQQQQPQSQQNHHHQQQKSALNHHQQQSSYPDPSIPNFDNDVNDALSADSASVSSRSSSPSEFMSDHELDELNGYSSKQTDDGYSVAMSSMQNRQFMDNGMIAAEYSNKLLDYFMAPDDERVPDFLIHPPEGFQINQVIDDEGHTAFHWACSMGILKIIEVLMDIGADVRATNLVGQTPLMRSVMFTNCFDRRTFPRIVELLRDTIFITDPERRTILHHIAVTTSSRSKLSSTRYYTEIILAKLSETQPMHDLAAFLDRQDVNGDTALHIAARHQARKLCKVLLSYHASATVTNKSGMSAYDFLVQDSNMRKYLESDPTHAAALKSSSSPARASMSQIDSNGNYPGNSSKQQQQHHHNHQQQQQQLISTPLLRQQQQLQHQQFQHQLQPQPHHTPGAANGYSMNGYGQIRYPHVAEAAIKATQDVAPTMNSHFEALANAYDVQLREKETDLEQVHQLLSDMNSDIANTEENIRQQQMHLGGEEDMVRQRIQEGDTIVNKNLIKLRKLVERTQAKDLANLVQEEESRIDESSMMNGQDQPEELLELARELADLQSDRKKLLHEITELHAKAGVGEKMNDYRRLLATSCGVGMDEIDDMLDSIAQALTENHEEEIQHTQQDQRDQSHISQNNNSEHVEHDQGHHRDTSSVADHQQGHHHFSLDGSAISV